MKRRIPRPRLGWKIRLRKELIRLMKLSFSLCQAEIPGSKMNANRKAQPTLPTSDAATKCFGKATGRPVRDFDRKVRKHDVYAREGHVGERGYPCLNGSIRCRRPTSKRISFWGRFRPGPSTRFGVFGTSREAAEACAAVLEGQCVASNSRSGWSFAPQHLSAT